MRRLLSMTLFATLPLVPLRARAVTTVDYYGGPVVSTVKIHQIIWTSNVPMKTQTDVAAFYQAIATSAYVDWLGEYDTVGLNGKDGDAGSNQRITRGTFGSKVVITPANTATTLADTDVGNELAAQIAAGKIPAPEFDATGNALTYYAVDFPSTITVTLGGTKSCTDFCFASGMMMVGGKPVPFGLLPDVTNAPCAGGCGNDAVAFNNVTLIHSEALLDVLTSPNTPGTGARPGAWMQSDGERIGDLCNQQPDTILGYTVNKGWSRKKDNCISSDPTLSKCNGTTHPCAPCGPGDCSGATSACETRGTSAKYGLCVQCIDDTTCSGATPKCDLGTDTCVAASAPDGGSGGPDGGQGADAGTGGTMTDAGAGAAADAGGLDGGGASAAPGSNGGGCSCRTADGADVPWASLGLAGGVLGLLLRRRRRALR